MTKPLTLRIFKGIKGKFGALNFNLMHPNKKDDEKIYASEGCVFLEIAAATGPNVYDWSNKIIFALSFFDVAQLLFGLRTGEEVKLMHDPGMKSGTKGQIIKNLQFVSPQGILKGGLLSVSQIEGEATKKYTVPLNGPEALALATLFTEALPKLLGW